MSQRKKLLAYAVGAILGIVLLCFLGAWAYYYMPNSKMAHPQQVVLIVDKDQTGNWRYALRKRAY